MEQNIYSPANNLGCRYRFTCGAVKCRKFEVTSKPPCYIEKFSRYQPRNDIWYQSDWEEVKRISWREVFSLQRSWIYALLIIIIITFIFMSMVLIYVLLKANRH